MTVKERFTRTKNFLLAPENRIGAIVLLIGALALVWALGAAISTFTSGGDDQEEAAEMTRAEETQAQVDNFRRGSNDFGQANNAEEDEELPEISRQTDISTRDITGAWDHIDDNGRILLQLQDGFYKLAILPTAPNRMRRFSIGTFTKENDLLRFEPTGFDDEARAQFPGYRPLTYSGFPLRAVRDGRRLILLEPSADMNIYSPPRHPVLGAAQEGQLVMEPLR